MDNYLKAALSVEQLKVSYVQNKKRLPVLCSEKVVRGNPLVGNRS